ncbi:MAG: putative Ig domain-containing protein [Proteobacteria bacterium]|nr:putative Ig domain-containing protein [Pseudomonadota bacterium]
MRFSVLSVLMSLVLAACGAVGVNSGPNSSATGVTGSSGSSSNTPPQISGTPAPTVIAGSAYAFTPTASDADGDTLTFSITNLPDWASFDSTTGAVSGTPPPASVGAYPNITISVSDGQATTSLSPFSIAVLAPLTISGNPPTTVPVGSAYSFQPTTNAPSGTALTFSIMNAPAWASFDAATGLLSGTPTQAGTFANIVISVTDGTQTSSMDAFTIIVATPNPGNQPPTISGTPATSAQVGKTYFFTPSASDPNGLSLTFSVANRPAWLSFDPATGSLAGAPGAANVGTYPGIVITVTDGQASASLPAFSIQVTAALTISGTPPTSVAAGTGYSFQPKTNAAAGTQLTFSVQNAPSWAAFNAATGQLAGTPTSSQVGTYSNIVISVSDGTQTATLPAFSIKVTSALTISGTPPTQATVGTAYSFTPTTNASSGTSLTFSIQNKPTWAAFSTATGQLSGTPTSGQVGTYSNIVISVTDGTQTSTLPAFSIKVATAPTLTISGTPATSVNVGSAYSFTPTVNNPAGGTLTFSIQNKPSWANFNSGTGQLTGTPAAANAGTTSGIVISVSNGTDSASLGAFNLTVNQSSNGTATLDWTAVTLNTNGSALTNLAGYYVYYGTSQSNMNQTVKIANSTVTTYLVQNLSSGTWYFGVAAYTTTGVIGQVSNVGSKSIP